MIDIVLDMIKRGKAQGLVYEVKSTSKSVSSSAEGLERIQEKISEGMGIIVIKDGRKAFVSVASPDEEKLKNAVDQALQMVKFVEPDDGNVISSESELEPIPGLYDPSVESEDLSHLKDLSMEMVKTAMEYDPRVKFVRSASVSVSVEEYRVVTTEGVDKSVKISRASSSIMCSAVDESGGSMGYSTRIGRNVDEISPRSVAEMAAEQAVSGLGAEVEKTGVYDIVLDPDVVATLFFFAYQPFSGENVFKKSSFLKVEDIGKRLFSEKLSILNDPRDPKLVGSIPFDSEGTNTRRFYVVENGILKSFFHNLYSAKKLGMEPTGNAFSRSFRSVPAIDPVNLKLEANATREEILSSVERGIYVVHMMGVHTMDPVSGRFSVQIAGHMIENGGLTKPIRGMALSGYLKDFLSNVEMVGDDYVHYGPVSGSTVLVREMNVGGK